MSMPSPSSFGSLNGQKLDESSFVEFDHVAAGHDGVRCDLSGSLIAKPCTQQEVAFYESSIQHPQLSKFIPTFIGTLSSNPEETLDLPVNEAAPNLTVASGPSSGTDTPLTPELAKKTEVVSIPEAAAQQNKEWVPSNGRKLDTGLSIVLENVAAGFKRPNVLDVKLGARLWADDSALAKRAKLDEISQKTTSSSLGFRIAGMKIWVGEKGKCGEEGGKDVTEHTQPTEGGEKVKSKVTIVEADGGYKRYDKGYGRSFNKDNVKEGFQTFIAGAKAGDVDRSKLIARRLAIGLRSIQSALEAEESRMYSASILIVYEGDPKAFEEALEKEASGVQQKEREESSEEEDLPEGALEVVDISIGGESISQGSMKLEIDPATAQLEDLEDDEDELPHKVHDIRLIDFAHASWTPGQGPDENALHGIRSVAAIMEQLAE